MAMGMDFDVFWRSNPKIISVYQEAYILKKKKLDEEMWSMGAYVQVAVSVALDKGLHGKKSKLSYPDKPMYAEHEIQSGELSEEDKIKQTNALFAKLQVMGENFKLEKGGK